MGRVTPGLPPAGAGAGHAVPPPVSSKGSRPSTRPGTLAFFGTLAPLADARAFARALAPVRRKRWVVYAKPPFAGPKAVLAYLSRYTHRVAISQPAHPRLRREKRQLWRQGLSAR